MTPWKSVLGAATLVAVGAFAPRAEALQLEMTPGELCHLSDMVVMGQVTDVDTLWSAGELGGIERRAFMTIRHVVHGTNAPSVEVVLPGGVIDGYRHWVEDVPDLRPNQHYLLFLSRVGDHLQVIGGDMGAVEVTFEGAGAGITVKEALASLEGCHAR